MIYPCSRNKDIPTPSHFSDTMGGNMSLEKILGEDITSLMKEDTKGGGRWGVTTRERIK